MDLEPREIIRRLKDEKALKEYFQKAGYVIPDTFEYMFIAQQWDLPFATKDMEEKEARAYVLRLVTYYIQAFTHEPELFHPENLKGAVNLEQADQLITFCSSKEWFHLRAIMKFIKRKVEER